MPAEAINRRELLRRIGAGTALVAGGPLLAGCGAFGERKTANLRGSAADEVTGSFSWERAKGQTIRLLLNKHPYSEALIPELKTFERLTGITVSYDVFPEANYFDKLTIELVGGQATYDAFMTGAYTVWQYGPPGWLENLTPWIRNESATNPEYDWEDIYENLREADAWDFKLGSPLGTGSQWAIPWGWESNVIAYQADHFEKLGLRPPETMDELEEVARAYQEKAGSLGVDGAYGLATRGSRSWATIHPGFMTQYTREGAKDFATRGSTLTPQMNSRAAVDFTRRWLRVARDYGPPAWTSYTFYQAAIDLGVRKAGMMYDATTAGYPQDQEGASPAAGNLAWAPGPSGRDGSLDTNLWVWSLAINGASERKLAAWLFLQWATGKDHLLNGAVNANHVDPVRDSVVKEPRFRDKISRSQGYLDTLEQVRPVTKIQFTPQFNFFSTTTSWAAALQEIYLGKDAQDQLDSLADDVKAKLEA